IVLKNESVSAQRCSLATGFKNNQCTFRHVRALCHGDQGFGSEVGLVGWIDQPQIGLVTYVVGQTELECAFADLGASLAADGFYVLADDLDSRSGVVEEIAKGSA